MRAGQNPVDILWTAPATPGEGAFLVTDPRGQSRHAYVGLSQSHFYELDLYSGAAVRLPVFPAAFVYGAGMCAAYDANRGRVWVVGPGAGAGDDSHTAYWNLATGAWVAADAGNTLDGLLAATWSIDGSLYSLDADLSAAYPITNGAGIVDLVLRGGNLNQQYQFGVAADAWVASTAPGAASGTGCSFAVPWAIDAGGVYTTHGGASAVMRRWDIAADTWGNVTPIPPFTSTFNLGSSMVTHCDGRLILARVANTGRIVAYDPVTNAQVPYARIYGPDGGTGMTGTRMCAYKQNGDTYLAVLLHGSTQIQRIRIVE